MDLLPRTYYNKKYRWLQSQVKHYDLDYLQDRVAYYLKNVELNTVFPPAASTPSTYKRKGNTAYYFDLKSYLRYLDPSFTFVHKFGDEMPEHTFPTLQKARKINGSAQTVLFKLNQRRHFRWVDDSLPYREKKDMLVWRGSAYQPLRRTFVQQYYGHPLCDVGQTNSKKEDVAWQVPFMSIKDQLTYKMVCCPEGNDVATNLKWAMSSQSLVVMPRPTAETWFMEGRLVAGRHYVEVASDFSDLEDVIHYYLSHPTEAEAIIDQASLYIKPFQDSVMEDILCIAVLEAYARCTGQDISRSIL